MKSIYSIFILFILITIKIEQRQIVVDDAEILFKHSSIQFIIKNYLQDYASNHSYLFQKQESRNNNKNNNNDNLLRAYGQMKQRNNILRMPSSFAVLMNFREDGTSSLQLMESMDLVYWHDAGYCKHGQTYNPLSKRCSDILCLTGSMLFQSANGYDCIKDESTAHDHDELVVPDEMVVEMTIEHRLCVLTQTQILNDDQSDILCRLKSLLKYENLTTEIQKSITNMLSIGFDRIENLQIMTNGSVMTNLVNSNLVEIDEVNADSYEDRDDEETGGHETDENDEINSNEDGLIINNPLIERNRLNMIEKPLRKFAYQERLVVQFRIRDQKLFDPNLEKQKAIELYYNLVAVGFFKTRDKLLNRKVIYTNTIEQKGDANNLEWCTASGYSKKPLTEGFRILNDKFKKYLIYDLSTKSFYPSGYFYLTIIYKTKEKGPKRKESQNKFKIQANQIINPLNEDSNFTFNAQSIADDLKAFNLTDITDEILEANNTDIITYKYLIVCDRPAKIRNIKKTCPKMQTIKMRICEFVYHMNNKSYYWPQLKKYYSIDEYEYDSEEPEKYIHVCNFIDETLIDRLASNEPNVTLKIHGYISFISLVISLTALFAVLITYCIFSQLRNVPGWNLIFLTIALIIAQSSFLAGSILSRIPLGCFILALLTHYGFLASFFWMNVIAFDLFRNFRDKSSHILLNMVKVRTRLSKYALYGWLSPFLIVLSGVFLDLYLRDPTVKRFKPCYAAYLQGCNQHRLYDLKDETEHVGLANASSSSIMDHRNGNFTNKCSDNMISTILTKTCWIMHGTANFMLFGFPIGLIIISNGVYFFMTVYNIRKMKRNQKKSKMRRFSRVKLPGDEDVKFYVQMAFIMGFTWITGFIMTTFLKYYDESEIINNIFIYLFILSNALIGVFIFFAFIFKRDVRLLYLKLFKQKFGKGQSTNGSSNFISVTNASKIMFNRRNDNPRLSESSTKNMIKNIEISNETLATNLSDRSASHKTKKNNKIACKNKNIIHSQIDSLFKSRLNEIKARQTKSNNMIRYSDSSIYDDVFY